MKDKSKLFITGMTQVFFVAINTFFISKSFYFGVLTTSFMISWVWSYNVKKISIGGARDRLAYCTGAAAGAVLGLALSEFLITQI